jgi:hypothetical protein
MHMDSCSTLQHSVPSDSRVSKRCHFASRCGPNTLGIDAGRQTFELQRLKAANRCDVTSVRRFEICEDRPCLACAVVSVPYKHGVTGISWCRDCAEYATLRFIPSPVSTLGLLNGYDLMLLFIQDD